MHASLQKPDVAAEYVTNYLQVIGQAHRHTGMPFDYKRRSESSAVCNTKMFHVFLGCCNSLRSTRIVARRQAELKANLISVYQVKVVAGVVILLKYELNNVSKQLALKRPYDKEWDQRQSILNSPSFVGLAVALKLYFHQRYERIPCFCYVLAIQRLLFLKLKNLSFRLSAQ